MSSGAGEKRKIWAYSVAFGPVVMEMVRDLEQHSRGTAIRRSKLLIQLCEFEPEMIF